jgi:hypothetical protein
MTNLQKRFDAEIHSCDLAGMAASAAVAVLLDNWKDSGDTFPDDIDDVISLLTQWKTIVHQEKA